MFSCDSTERRNVCILEVQDDLFISCDSNRVYMLGNTKTGEQPVSLGGHGLSLPPSLSHTRNHRKLSILNWSGRIFLEMTGTLGILGKSCQLP